MTEELKVEYKDDHSKVVVKGDNPETVIAQFWGENHAEEAFDYCQKHNIENSTELKHRGHLRIGTYTGDGNPVFFQLTDKLSGRSAVEVRMTRQAFAEALFNRGVDVTFEVRGVELIGMKCIHNRVKLKSAAYRPDVGSPAYLLLTDQLQPLLDEGWDFRNDDLENGHNYSRDGEGEYTVTVHTWKYVDPESEEAKEWEAAQDAKHAALSKRRKKGK